MSKSGLFKVDKVVAMSSKGAKKESMGSKGAIGGPLGDKLNLTLGISELHLKSKKSYMS